MGEGERVARVTIDASDVVAWLDAHVQVTAGLADRDGEVLMAAASVLLGGRSTGDVRTPASPCVAEHEWQHRCGRCGASSELDGCTETERSSAIRALGRIMALSPDPSEVHDVAAEAHAALCHEQKAASKKASETPLELGRRVRLVGERLRNEWIGQEGAVTAVREGLHHDEVQVQLPGHKPRWFLRPDVAPLEDLPGSKLPQHMVDNLVADLRNTNLDIGLEETIQRAFAFGREGAQATPVETPELSIRRWVGRHMADARYSKSLEVSVRETAFAAYRAGALHERQCSAAWLRAKEQVATKAAEDIQPSSDDDAEQCERIALVIRRAADALERGEHLVTLDAAEALQRAGTVAGLARTDIVAWVQSTFGRVVPADLGARIESRVQRAVDSAGSDLELHGPTIAACIARIDDLIKDRVERSAEAAQQNDEVEVDTLMGHMMGARMVRIRLRTMLKTVGEPWIPRPLDRVRVTSGLSTGEEGVLIAEGEVSSGGVRMWTVDLYRTRRRLIRQDFLELVDRHEDPSKERGEFHG